MNGVLDLSLWQVMLSLVLVAVALVVSITQRLGMGRDIAVGSARTVLQLYLVGLILTAVFAAARWWWVLLILAAMIATATFAAVGRLPRKVPRVRGMAALALTVSSAATLAWVIGVVIRVEPWYTPQYIIPIAGMIVGNSLTSSALAGDRLQGELRARSAEVEARLALGFSGREAVQPMVRAALRTSMIPSINALMTVGIVQLPGMMTGQILAGSSPGTAIRYQIVVMFMMTAATALSSLLFVRMLVSRYLTPADQLRRYLV